MERIESIDRVSATIVNELGELGVYHYNKLTYLFEFFYIKNFGERFSKEKFIKITHGPIISNYKKRISALSKADYLSVDVSELNKKKSLDDFNKYIPIHNTLNTKSIILDNPILISLIHQIIEKFSKLPVKKLEEIVYKTSPIRAYCNPSFNKKTGGYVFPNHIKVKSFRNSITEGRRQALKHFNKYNYVEYDQQKDLLDQFEILNRMRPEV